MLAAALGADPGLEGALVEIFGVGGQVEPYVAAAGLASSLPAVEVDGQHGRCVAWSSRFQKYFVQLFSGLYVLIPGDCLRPWDPPPPLEGGFDLAWPSPFPGKPLGWEQVQLFALELADALERKGWCLVQLPVDEVSRATALDQAAALRDLESPRAELLTDLLGRDGDGKVSFLEPGDLEEDEDGLWALADFDRQLTSLARALAPLTAERMGFRSRGRRKGMVCVPFQSALEEQKMQPERLTEDDIEAGVLEAHLEFIRSRRLCFLSLIDNEGGELTLYPRRDTMADAQPVTLPLSGGKLLVYRCDHIAHSCTPATRNAVSLTTWVLDDELDKQRLTGGMFAGDALQRAEAMGILTGPPMPTGFRTHIMATHAHSPCDVHNIEEFAMIFAGGCDGYCQIPAERFDIEIYCTSQYEERHPFKSYVIHSAMLETSELRMFDNAFFGICDEEASFVSPGQRVVLQDGYTTLHKAGFTKHTLRGRSMGAYCGDTGSEFSCWGQLPKHDHTLSLAVGLMGGGSDKPYGKVSGSPFAQAGVMSIVTANRLSHCFGMKGGASSVDTACSASLVGVAVAVQNFRRPEGEQLGPCVDKRNEDALCVGISCLLTPFAFIALCGPSMLSPKGRCFTFDVGATGYARGEGFAGAYIRPSDSEEDNARQVACLMGVAVNQDGRSATLTAPNGMAQQACIRDSMREAGIVANQITIGECHGTGTALGDPIEVGAYRGVMEPREVPVLATSAKSNIGHLECCAGLTGLLKCCVMVNLSCAAPNVHLNILNPHLDTEGFPVYFETEHTDTGLSSNFAGVSSFGFSGTNARADVWGKCGRGARRAVEADTSKMQVHVQCPVSLGLMDMLTGENVVPGRSPEAKAAVLRDEWAPYDISRYAYSGGLRYRPADEVPDEELDPFVGVYIYGSWTAFRQMQEMQRSPDGWHVATVVLGETRCERFRLCLNETPDLDIYPTADLASDRIWIEGPDAKADGRSWCIDGRDLEVPAGTAFEVRFKWHRERKRVEWRRASSAASPASSALAFRHCYSLVGTFTTERFVEMARDREGGWTASFRIGASGEEEFQIARDNDWQQVVYPAIPRAVRTTVPVRGPDHLHGGKAWLVQGRSGDVVMVRLGVDDGHVSVEVSSESKGTKRWQSIEGWERHEYCVIGSWTDDRPVAMAFDSKEQCFKAYGKVAEASADGSGYTEAFQLVVDGDLSQAIYPQLDGSDSGESIVLGPGVGSEGRSWEVSSPVPGARFEIRYDPHVADRRKVVTWSWMERRAW